MYAQAAIATGDSWYARIADATAQWALREMRSPQGAFYSSLDADSEGHEACSTSGMCNRCASCCRRSNSHPSRPALAWIVNRNFEGRWHLHALRPLEEIGRELNRSEAQVSADIEAARATLLAARSTRVRPRAR